MIKKQIYIFLTILLGILLSTIVHAVFEMGFIFWYIANPEKYSLGLSWNQLLWLHAIYTVVFFLLGAIGGYFLGKKWWNKIYEN